VNYITFCEIEKTFSSLNNGIMELSILQTLHETTLQRLVRTILSDSSRSWRSENGTPLQILSLGEWNHAAGPDFLGVAVSAEGRVHVGNAEFHRAASDWLAHEHSTNPAFSGLLLHIVIKNNSRAEFARYTLVVPESEIAAALNVSVRDASLLEQSPTTPHEEHNSLLVVHDWAVRRMLRKSEYAASILNPYKPHETLIQLLSEFYHRQRSQKRRPRGMTQMEALQAFLLSHSANMLSDALSTLTNSAAERVSTTLSHLLETRIHTEGAATRQELLLNIVVPLGIALCTYFFQKTHSEELWKWYFALPAQNVYTALQRRFPTIPQDFVYQQQGLLEYLAETHPPERPKAAPIHTFRPEAAHVTAEYVITLYDAAAAVVE
jgi:hypothetical protein